MEKIRLSFDTETRRGKKTYNVEVPYNDGLVVTSEFCPIELLNDKVDLIAAIRGEPLEKFMEDCRNQVVAISKIEETDSELDRHIGGLMAVVMGHLSLNKTLSLGKLLIYIDCFSLLLKGAGFKEKEIYNIYPRVAQTIKELYSEYICAKEISEEEKF